MIIQVLNYYGLSRVVSPDLDLSEVNLSKKRAITFALLLHDLIFQIFTLGTQQCIRPRLVIHLKNLDGIIRLYIMHSIPDYFVEGETSQIEGNKILSLLIKQLKGKASVRLSKLREVEVVFPVSA